MIRINRIFTKYDQVNEEKYNKIISIANKEITKYSSSSNIFMGKNFLLKRSLELIESINNYNSDIENTTISSLANLDHRRNIQFNKNIEKQIFINNFVFNDLDNFVSSLKLNNIDLEYIENLIDMISIKKKEQDINLDIDLSNVCNYFNFNNEEIIVNKIYELYYKNYDLLKEKLSQKKR